MCLVDPHGNMVIYIESLSRIDVAIQRQSFSKLLHREKIGGTCLFSLDESKQMLAVYSSARVRHSFRSSPYLRILTHARKMQLHIFAFENEGRSLREMGSTIELLPFYNNGDSIVHACFVHGRKEIMFVDSSAQARIFSCTMLQPK